MSETESDLDQQCQAKKWKLDDNPNQNQNEVAIAGPSNIETSSDIYKMDIDCFEELFEWLSVADLRTLRLTSKRFKKIVDYYIRTHYPKIGKFKLRDRSFNVFRRMDSGTIGLINEIDVWFRCGFDANPFESIKELLSKVPKISIIKWEIDSDFYNLFMKYCTNVKSLYINRKKLGIPIIDISDEWLNHQYQSIEYFGIDYIYKHEIYKFITFFILNPNIHAFSIKLECVIRIGWRFIEAGIKFDRLYIDATDRQINKNDIDSLKKLYDAKFYKRLCINCKSYGSTKVCYSKFSSIGTEVINVHLMSGNFGIPLISSLKELNIDDMLFDETYENVNNIVERLSCKSINFEYLLVFIGKFPKLKHFKICHIWGTNELNLIAMNKERQKLAGACKTTIYVHEDIFLATKWAKTKTNFNLIELKRIQTCDWDQFFESNCGKCTDKASLL